MQKKRGNPNLVAGPGRPKGSLNKTGIEIRKAISEALSEVGGKEYLVKLAKSEPKIFCILVAKIIPSEIELTHKNALDEMSTNDLVVLARFLGTRLERDSGLDSGGNQVPEVGSVPAVH